MGFEKDTLLVLRSSGLGEGEPDLGEKLLKGFLTMFSESGIIPAKIICINSGVFLTTEGSPVIEIMRKFEKEGVEILSCGTCLDYYGRRDKLIVGRPTNMKDTVRAILTFQKIISP